MQGRPRRERRSTGDGCAGELVALLALTALAAALRGWRLGELPPGMHVDEAFNLLDARAVMAGARPVFLAANAGREVLYTYLQAPLLALLGETLTVARLASALTGTLAVPAAYLFVRALPLSRPGRTALLTAALTALSYWTLHFSRFGIRAGTFPLVVALTMWAWWHVCRAPIEGRASWRPVALLGLLLGLAVYTHPAGRGLWAVPVAHAGLLWWRDGARGPARRLLVALGGAALVALPVGWLWWREPTLFAGHAAEVSIVGQGLGAIAANLGRVLGMFNLAGDPAPWRNLAGRPVFDPLVGVLFLAGLALVARAAWRGARWAALVLIWLTLLLLPSVLSDAAPNFSRAIGVVPAVFVLPALALDRAAAWVEARGSAGAAAVLMAAVLLISGGWTVRDYFGRWAEDPDTPIAFDADITALARYAVEQEAGGRPVYLSDRMAGHATVRAVGEGALRGFDPRHGLVYADGRPLYLYLPRIPGEDDAAAALAGQLAVRERIVRRGLGSSADDGASDQRAAGPISEDPAPDDRSLNDQTLDDRVAIDVHGRRDTGGFPIRRIQPRHPLEGGASRDAAGWGGDVVSGEAADPAEDPDSAEDGEPTEAADSAMDASPAAGQTRRIVFDGWLALTSMGSIDGPVRAGGVMTVTLAWSIQRTPTSDGRTTDDWRTGPDWHMRSDLRAGDWHTAVHVVGPDGETLAQGDGPPVGGSYPADRWRPNEVVVSHHPVRVPDDAPAGRAVVRVGWYDWRSGESLTTPDGATLVPAGAIDIER